MTDPGRHPFRASFPWSPNMGDEPPCGVCGDLEGAPIRDLASGGDRHPPFLLRFEYQVSRQIYGQHLPFYALVMAAMRAADEENLRRLKLGFPDVWAELEARYNAPGGLLAGETP